MSVKVENQEHNLVKLTIEIPAEEVNAEMDRVYLKERNKINIPGFRKGKAPRAMIEKMYGKGVFMEDAVNNLLPDAYEKAVTEAEEAEGFKIVSYPEIGYEQVEVGKDIIFTAVAAKKPEVTLGQYTGIEVEAPSTEVTEEDVLEAVKKEQEKNSTLEPVEDRPVADGDTVKLDYCGKVDGVAFDGGTAEDQDLVIGSGSFIPGFEEQLIGMNIGETKDITVTFPEQYHSEELAGKEAVFTCTINGIQVRVLPELDDEFASEVSDFETYDEYIADLKVKLTDEKQKAADAAIEDAVVEKVIENAEMDIPEMMVLSEARAAVNNFAQRLQQQGLSIEQYMQYTGMTEAQMVDAQKEPAEKNIKGRLVLEAVAAAEKLEGTDEDVDEELKKMAESYGVEFEDMKKWTTEDQIETMKVDIATRKALDFLRDSAAVK